MAAAASRLNMRAGEKELEEHNATANRFAFFFSLWTRDQGKAGKRQEEKAGRIFDEVRRE